MKIGACGIACEVCGLYIQGICQGCSPGDDPSAAERVKFLKEKGVLCPVFDCAVQKQVAHCLKDCDEFPCSILEGFPFGKSFLEMHKMRMSQAT